MDRNVLTPECPMQALSEAELSQVEGGWSLLDTFTAGYKFGQWLDKKYGLSDKIADAACRATNCNGAN